VHHGITSPVIYKNDRKTNIEPIIHLQCTSGIHFNAVFSSNKQYLGIMIRDKNVNTVSKIINMSE
jgi:hypothetical protein